MNGIINTIAGNGMCSYYGEGVAATDAALAFPRGLAVDAADNVYIADTENCHVRRVTGGTITTIAGHRNDLGRYCTSDGDSGPATAAGEQFPVAIAAAANGDVYVGEGCEIRRISAGIIDRFVGGGLGTCGSSGDGGPPLAATLQSVQALVVANDGSMYIEDNSCRVRRIAANVIRTVVGNGTCGFTGDGGSASAASIYYPQGIAVAPGGELFLSQTGGAGGCRIREVDANGSIKTIVGDGACTNTGDGGAANNASIQPGALALDVGGNLFVSAGCDVRRVQSGIIDQVAGTGTGTDCAAAGDGGPALAAGIAGSLGTMAFDSSGNLYMGEYQGRRVRIIYGIGSLIPATSTPTPTTTATPAVTSTATASPTSTATATATATPQPKPAVITYAGDQLKAAGAAVTLGGHVTQTGGGANGDLRQLALYVDLNGTIGGTSRSYGPLAVSAAGDASVTLSQGLTADVYQVVVRAAANPFFTVQPATIELPIFDPSATSSGTGWLLDGGVKADFTVNAKYGANDQVSGQLQYTYVSGNKAMKLRSSSLQWFVMQGSEGILRGSATLNGVAGYVFELTLVDSTNVAEAFGITVWRPDSSVEHAVPQTPLGGGSLILRPH